MADQGAAGVATSAGVVSATPTTGKTLLDLTVDANILSIEDKLHTLQPEYVGLFGVIDDKLPLIRLVRNVLPHTSIFTTDADLKYEGLTSENDLLIASTVNPRNSTDWSRLTDATSLLSEHAHVPERPASTNLRGDVYMVQYSRAVEFIFTLVERFAQSGQSPATLLPILQQHRRGLLFDREGRAVPTVEFDANGDLSESVQPATLMVVRNRHLVSLDPPRHTPVQEVLLDPTNPLAQFVWLNGLAVVAAGLMWSARRRKKRLQEATAAAATEGGTPAPEDLTTGASPVAMPLANAGDSIDHCRVSEAKGEEDAKYAGFLPLWYEKFFRVEGLTPFVRYQVFAFILFDLFMMVAIHEGRESISLMPNGHSICPSMAIRLFLVGICLSWIEHCRISLGQVHRHLLDWNLTRLAGDLKSYGEKTFPVTRFHYGVITICVVLTTLGEYRSRPPITGNETYIAYVIVSLLIQAVFFLSAFIAFRVWKIACFLSRYYPLEDDLETMSRRFRVLIVPFVDMTYVALISYAGFVVARTRIIDHWNWSVVLYIIYFSIFSMLYYTLYGIHRGWRDRMLAAKRRVLDFAGPLEGRTEQHKEMLRQVDVVHDWAWDARGPAKIILALAVPILSAMLQSSPVAAQLLQAVGRLFG